MRPHMVQKRSESFEKREHSASSEQYGADGRKVPEINPIRRSDATMPEGLSLAVATCAAERESPLHAPPPLRASPPHIAETGDSSIRETASPERRPLRQSASAPPSDRPSREKRLFREVVRPEETRAVKAEASPPDRSAGERRPSRERRPPREVVRSAATRATHDEPIAVATPRHAELEVQLAAAKAMALKARRANDTPLALQKMRECKQIQAEIVEILRSASRHDCSTGGPRINTSVAASTGGCSDEPMPNAPQLDASQQLMRDAVFIASTVRSLPHAKLPSLLRPMLRPALRAQSPLASRHATQIQLALEHKRLRRQFVPVANESDMSRALSFARPQSRALSFVRPQSRALSFGRTPSSESQSRAQWTRKEDRALFCVLWSGATGEEKRLPKRSAQSCKVRLQLIKCGISVDKWARIIRVPKDEPHLVETLSDIMADDQWYDEVFRHAAQIQRALDLDVRAEEGPRARDIYALHVIHRILQLRT